MKPRTRKLANLLFVLSVIAAVRVLIQLVARSGVDPLEVMILPLLVFSFGLAVGRPWAWWGLLAFILIIAAATFRYVGPSLWNEMATRPVEYKVSAGGGCLFFLALFGVPLWLLLTDTPAGWQPCAEDASTDQPG